MALLGMSAADWESVGDVDYRKWEVYEMLWSDVDVEQYHFACSQFAGPLAIVADERKMVQVRGAPSIRIFSQSGRKLGEIPWQHPPTIPGGFFWTEQCTLLCIQNDGIARMFTLHGASCGSFSFLPQLTEETLIFASVCPRIPADASGGEDGDDFLDGGDTTTGVVVLSTAMRLYLVRDVTSARVEAMAGGRPLVRSSKQRRITCMAVLEPCFTSSGGPEVLCATSDGTLLVATTEEVQDQELQSKLSSPVLAMAVCPNGRYVACFTSAGMLCVLSTSFTDKVLEFDTRAGTLPQQLLWCGEDSIVMYWKQLGLLMVGPFGQYVKYDYSDALVLVQEMDCCRILSTTSHEILQRVPAATAAICQLGSTSAAALLFDAMEAFESGDAKADESIRDLGDSLAEAVEDTVEAAACEFSTQRQQALLRAAAYGKCFHQEFEHAELFTETCRKLRVLNTIRSPQVGVALTAAQYERLTPDVLVDRLVMLHQHRLALRVCEYLEMPADRVLVHWACAKITCGKSGGSDEELTALIRRQLGSRPGISYAEIASTADRAGRRALAVMLLAFEPRAEDQVPQLLSMQETSQALARAVESRDPNLINLVLLELYRKLLGSDASDGSGGDGESKAGGSNSTVLSESRAQFFGELVPFPLAVSMFKAYARHQNTSLLKDMYYYADRTCDAGSTLVRAAYGSRSMKGRLSKLGAAAALYNNQRSLGFHARATEDEMMLLRRQMDLEKKNPGDAPCVDLSLNETITHCILHGHASTANSLKKEFKVPDKRFWYLKVNALAESRNWPKLLKFANEKRSPIGYRPFAEAAIRGREMNAAKAYIKRISDPLEQLELYQSIGGWSEAAEIAFRLKDGERLAFIRSHCGIAAVEVKIDQYAQQLGLRSVG